MVDRPFEAMVKADLGVVAFRIPVIPRTTHVNFRQQRRADLDEVFKAARGLWLDELILPGWTFVYSKAELGSGAFRADVAWLKERTSKHDLRVLAELR